MNAMLKSEWARKKNSYVAKRLCPFCGRCVYEPWKQDRRGWRDHLRKCELKSKEGLVYDDEA